MAKDQFSFDIVSEVDMQEVRNAVDQTGRELSQRFDFKGTDTSITLGEGTIELHSSTEDRLKAAWQVLQERAVKRSIPLKALQAGTIEDAAKGTSRQTVTIVTGISDEKTKEISKFVRQASAEDPDADPGGAGPSARQEQGRPAGRDPSGEGARLRPGPAVHELPSLISALTAPTSRCARHRGASTLARLRR